MPAVRKMGPAPNRPLVLESTTSREARSRPLPRSSPSNPARAAGLGCARRFRPSVRRNLPGHPTSPSSGPSAIHFPLLSPAIRAFFPALRVHALALRANVPPPRADLRPVRAPLRSPRANVPPLRAHLLRRERMPASFAPMSARSAQVSRPSARISHRSARMSHSSRRIFLRHHFGLISLDFLCNMGSARIDGSNARPRRRICLPEVVRTQRRALRVGRSVQHQRPNLGL